MKLLIHSAQESPIVPLENNNINVIKYKGIIDVALDRAIRTNPKLYIVKKIIR